LKRILVFELNWLGDILFSFPFLRAIRKEYPEAYIACAVVPRYAELFKNNPWINDVHALSDDNSILSLREKISFIMMIKEERYDTCFLLKPSRLKAVMAAMAGIPERIGFSGKRSPLTREVDVPRDHYHRADQILALAGAVGVKAADSSYEYFVSEEDEERAHDLLREAGGGKYRAVVLNPGGNWQFKRWPKENFALLARNILSRFDDVEIIITGSAGDLKIAEYIMSVAGPVRCSVLCGKTSLNELAVIFKDSEAVVSADSGPLHLASAAGARTIALFGPTLSHLTGPRGKGRSIVISKDVGCSVPCYIDMCAKDNACMKSITVDEVFCAVEKELA